jgi:hypothetical protein
LLQANNLTYVGAFRLPSGGVGALYGFDFGETGFAFNAAHNSLFLNNHIYEQKTAEVAIPTLSTDMSRLQTGTFLQHFADITEGRLGNILAGGACCGANGTVMGGLLVYGNKLIGTAYSYYDPSGEAQLSHFTSGLDLSMSGDFRGMYKVGTLSQGFYGGYMTLIPSEWRAAFGGPALTGLCCIAIISRSSYGPAAFVFDPDDLGTTNPVPAAPVVYYPQDHPTLGMYENSSEVNLYYNKSTGVRGVVFPTGTQSVLFFGSQGTGVPCYGIGTSDQSLDRQLTGEGNVYCYDPVNNYKAPHTYPYRYWVWAYDANDLVAVKNGLKKPWDVKPYAMWPLDLPLAIAEREINGAAYDPATKRIYLSQYHSDTLLPGGYAAPVIQVFQVNDATPLKDEGAPTVPTSLTASAASASQIRLAWRESTDNVSVIGYKVFRNGTLVGESATSSYVDNGLSVATTYTYTVSAYDAAGNQSAESGRANATTDPKVATSRSR